MTSIAVGPERLKRVALLLLSLALLVGSVLQLGGTGSVHAAGTLEILRAPGEAGMVAAHRGDRSNAPENTLPAYLAALDSGAQLLETDVRLTADGVPVLMHDATVDRTTSGSGWVFALDSDAVRALDAGSWHAEEFAGTPVPTLAELLTIAAPTEAILLLELKGRWGAEGVRLVRTLVYEHGMHDRVMLASFDRKTLRQAQLQAPELPRIVVTSGVPRRPLELVEQYEASAFMTRAKSLIEHDRLVDDLHSAGVAVMVYTLNTQDDWAAALALGVDAVVTDAPRDLRSWYGGAG
ncbi:glycerophosphodiester phosphodiesterase [Ruicaihuangia caeni]|uniref:glycerophosphodiester phosphodiesterase n=1 Tax=Ruicaihuangia caeni TaxID=3042517 RepID=UPI0033905872